MMKQAKQLKSSFFDQVFQNNILEIFPEVVGMQAFRYLVWDPILGWTILVPKSFL